jgi:hypothetical protein
MSGREVGAPTRAETLKVLLTSGYTEKLVAR